METPTKLVSMRRLKRASADIWGWMLVEVQTQPMRVPFSNMGMALEKNQWYSPSRPRMR